MCIVVAPIYDVIWIQARQEKIHRIAEVVCKSARPDSTVAHHLELEQQILPVGAATRDRVCVFDASTVFLHPEVLRKTIFFRAHRRGQAGENEGGGKGKGGGFHGARRPG